MIKWIAIPLLLILACSNAPAPKKMESSIVLKPDSIIPIEALYKQLNDSVKLVRKDWQARQKKGVNEQMLKAEAVTVFTELIYESYFKFWNGTPWEFYGTTRIPQKGAIACGYFVTTVLEDMSVTINRIEMAKTYSEKMIKTLVQPENIKKYSPFNLTEFVTELRKRKDGVYLAGLDNHTGFIVVKNHEVYFIHSSVISPGCVVREKALESVALQINRYTVLGCLTEDSGFMKRWMYSH
ncbi:MAG: hypothetical protein CFE21_01990 [Bacteroidetes bacterium B1(2017)]|nr:MAG: hypothetical protein CFE21_01990 [Bacteroidetes bacterium B1(2017)]